MKTQYIALAAGLFLLPALRSSAQGRYSRYFKEQVVSFSGGAALPSGKLKTQGYAVTGVAVEFTWTYKFWKNFGYMGSCSSRFFETDGKAREDQLRQADPLLTTKEKGSWASYMTHWGVYGYIPVSNASKFSIEPRLLLGIGKTQLPEFAILSPGGESITLKSSSRVFTYGALAGATFKYHITKECYLLASADFNWTKPVLNKVKAENQDGDEILMGYPASAYYPKMVNSFSFKLGFGILVKDR